MRNPTYTIRNYHSKDFEKLVRLVTEVRELGRSYCSISLLDLLESLSQRLVADGRLYCSFPNNESLRARIFKERWAMVRPIGHLHYFSCMSIDYLMAKNNLTVTYRRKHEAWGGLRAILRSVFSFLVQFKLYAAIKTLSSGMLSLFAEWLGMGDQWLIISTKEK